MKKFDFKLQPVLKFREYHERLAKQMTAKAHMDLDNCEKQIAQLKDRYLNAQLALEKDMTKGMNAKKFRQHHSYMGNIETDIKNHRLNRIELKKRLEKKIEELKKKRVDKKVIELLKEKRQKEYNEEVNKQDQKTLDEISSQKKSRELVK